MRLGVDTAGDRQIVAALGALVLNGTRPGSMKANVRRAAGMGIANLDPGTGFSVVVGSPC
ncbi:hypothetical protein [Amycolatopsis minnesotensis]|uniref:Uncharacterized protein n=1 Tax=Amycolatopsis minnesotensis TaxID=337894 RepID=A0ABN2QZ26_9PSEU